MSRIINVKSLNKDLVLAIDWAASEYKYVKELQQELAEIHHGKEPLKNLRKASKILRYISRSERRVDRFEKRIQKGIKELDEEEFGLTDIIKGIRDIAKELEVEHAHLVKYSSSYDSLLEKELEKAAVEAALEQKIKEDNPKKAEQIHATLLQLVHQIEYQITDAEKWISALESSLKKAQQMLKELPDDDKMILQQRGLAILHQHRWPLPDDDKTTLFLVQHPTDLEEITLSLNRYAHYFFSEGLPAVKDLINERTWSGMVKMTIAVGPDASYIFKDGLPSVKHLINDRTWPIFVDGFVKMTIAAGENSRNLFVYSFPALNNLINDKSWPLVVEGLIKMTKAAGAGTKDLFFYGFNSVRHLINEETWPWMVKIVQLLEENSALFFRDSLAYDQKLISEESWPRIVQFIETHKDQMRQTLYSGQRIEFFKTKEGSIGIKRGELKKTGSRTILLGGSLLGKAIIRIISDKAFQGWKKAFEAKSVWKGLGFDYVPIEPILTTGGKLRAFKTKEGMWRVSTKVLGLSLHRFMASQEYPQYKQELAVMEANIEKGLNTLKIKHGHLHKSNFCIEMHEGKIRLYAIDFDQAVS